MSDRSISAGGDISRSVIVTGDGNAVSLCFGTSGIALPLDRKQIAGPDRRRQQGGDERLRELDVLDPARGRLPLIGREGELADLRAWLEDDVDISVHALTGPAGTGKTRLAIELCAVIDSGRTPDGDWVAAFLSPSELPRLTDVYATSTFEWARSTLLVIDYAAQGHEALSRWLDRLATQTLDGGKLRLLLLERRAPEGYGWWYELHDSPLNSAAGRRELFRQARPESLPGLDDLEVRQQVIAEALSATAKLHGKAGGDVPEAGADASFDARLSEPVFGNALSLVMAGVIGHERGLQNALALRRLDAARHLGRRELARFERLAGAMPEARALRHLVAFNGMAGGLPTAGLVRTLQAELAAIGVEAETAGLAELLQQELPPTATREEGTAAAPRLGTIQPDLIGEAVVVEAFEAPPDRQAEGAPAVQRAYALSGVEAAQALMRLLQDYAYAVEDQDASNGERQTGKRLLDWLRSLADEIKDPLVLEPLAFTLPQDTLVLREIAAEITGRLADAYGAGLGDKEKISMQAVNRAMVWTVNYSNRLSVLGNREAALAAATHATRLARGLFEADADVFREELAMSLDTLSNHLSELGRREEALAAEEEAVTLHRVLSTVRPGAFTPAFAGSLNNLANRLSDLGRREEALAAAEEAVAHHRALAEARPDAFTPALATSLNNLSNFLSELGRREEALAAAEEAAAHYRILAEARPDAFMPVLTILLNNLATVLSALGRREEAMAAAKEAVAHYRTLAEARPDAFTPALAGSLNNLANHLSDLGRREEALAAAKEAVAYYRTLAETRPDAFTPALAMSLNNLANVLSNLGRREEALAAAEEAAAHYRILAETRPDAFVPDFAMSLNNLANRLSNLGRREDALSAAEEAVELRRALAAARPDAFTPDLAGSLNNLANHLSGLGRLEEALSAAEETVALHRTLATTRPDAFSEDLSISLGMFSDLMVTMDDKPKAHDSVKEAIEVLAPVFLALPEAVAHLMEMHLKRYVSLCKELDRASDEALLRPIVEIFNRLNNGEKGNENK